MSRGPTGRRPPRDSRSRYRPVSVSGVACDLSGLGTWTPLNRDPAQVFATEDRERSTASLPPSVREWLSIASDGETALADMNDDGATFAEIAKWIRENPGRAFTQGADK